ncbi:MAG: Gfo/Idh/MocA family protein, partial [Gemmatimonadota bacterium]
MGFNQRFHPAVVRAREEIRKGTIGRVMGLRVASGAAPRELPQWKRRRAEGGGVLLDAFSHHADLARFLLDDEVREVTASVTSVRTEDDNAWATMTMAGGERVESRCSFTSVQENRFEVMGDAGGLAVDRIEGHMERIPAQPAWGRAARLRLAARRLRDLPRGVRSVLSPPGDPSFSLALFAFVRALREGSPTAPDLRDGERSLAVVLAAEAAARHGGNVTVAPPRA